MAAFLISVSPATAMSNLRGWLELLGWNGWAAHLQMPIPVMAMRASPGMAAARAFSLDDYWRQQDVFWLVIAVAIVAALFGIIVLLLSRRRHATA